MDSGGTSIYGEDAGAVEITVSLSGPRPSVNITIELLILGLQAEGKFKG